MWIQTIDLSQLRLNVLVVLRVLTFSKPKYLSLPSCRTGSSASGASSFSNAVGTGALGSFFSGGGAVEAPGVCEHAIAGQLPSPNWMFVPLKTASDSLQRKATPE
jgi:hypothetical protein